MESGESPETSTTLAHMRDNLDVFACPACGENLRMAPAVECARCGPLFVGANGIPCLLPSGAATGSRAGVTEKVRAFYESTPFPNYDGFETVSDLVLRAEEGLFAKMLNEQIPFRTRVLDAGCGTGQLSNYLALSQRTVFGIDMCANSLGQAQAFKDKCGLDRVGFYQMDLFGPAFKAETFDFVISLGVLHHTADPFACFESIARLVKRGGYILVGLYNRYGRLATDLRRGLFSLTGPTFHFLDERLRKLDRNSPKREAWLADQYNNPHESKHTMGEVLGWFRETGFEYTYGFPGPRPFTAFNPEDKLFETHAPGTALDHLLAQLAFMFRPSREGGLFIMIAQKE